ncbi:MAG: type II toxin-antitoxin system PrlF family antitoxin [Desulfotignum sp.]|nr:type II toxin-antitoxin system PrlF family antitoxin [Desulfotignum sp.]MCF8126233.1 type II toxin-antitoxin system PrlF family antitoxin [Desulfotignum sp.]
MASIETVATITTKGQITLPKSIRQALGVDSGDKIKFHLMDDQVIVTRIIEDSHEDPSIRSFLSLLEKDIQSGRHVTSLPEALATKMLAAPGQCQTVQCPV